MQQRSVGKTGERVSAIGLGCMGLVGWYGERDDLEAAATVQHALDIGINHLDTAAVYQDGENEKFVGRCIKGRRSEAFIATKCGMERTREGRITVDNRPEIIRTSCDASLQRLGIEQIDLFYVHRVDPLVPVEETMGAMARLVEAGKVRFVGLSEVCAETLCRANAVHPVAAVQSEFSLWSQRAAQPVLDTCRELDIAFVAYSPLARGFISGAIKQPSDLPADDTRRMFPRFSAANFDDNLAAAERVREVAQSKNCTAAQLALAWVLAKWEWGAADSGHEKA